MAAAVTYEGDARPAEPSNHGLFAGQTLYFSHNVPSRQRFMETAKANGAQIAQIDKQADIVLVDHAKKHQAPGTFSYRYVERSVLMGRLEDLEVHRVGSATRSDRPVGSIVTASKGGRNKFTDAEDQLLWNWIKPYMDAGGTWKGNEIYKQLEDQYPNHTFQSWRDRWMKYTQYQKRRITAGPYRDVTDDEDTVSPHPTKRQRIEDRGQTTSQQANISVVQSPRANPSSKVQNTVVMGNTDSSQTEKRAQPDNASTQTGLDAEAMVEKDALPTPSKSYRSAESSVSVDGNRLPLTFDFTQEEARKLYNAAPYILDARPDKLDESWADVAREHGHTTEAWKRFFYEVIAPEVLRRNGLKTDQEVEAYCKAKIREERRLQAQALAMNVDHESRFNGDDPSDSGNGLKETITAMTEQHEDIRDSSDHIVQALQPAYDANVEHQTMVQPVIPPSSASSCRPPQPNESRKLSQGRGSQSTSSQSKSTSQPSQPTTLKPLTDDLTSANTHDKDHLQSSRQTKADQHHELPATPQISQPSQVSEEHSNRLVTQFSQRAQTQTTDSDAELPDIPFKPLTPTEQNTLVKLPLFFPEESESAESGQQRALVEDTGAQLQSSPPVVRLINDEDVGTPRLRSSEYAASETPSEVVYFESQIRLSQAWETAPDDVLTHTDLRLQRDTAGDSNRASNEAHSSTTSSLNADVEAKAGASDSIVLSNHKRAGTGSMDDRPGEETEAGYETAPTRQETEQSNYDQDGTEEEDFSQEQHKSVPKQTKNRLETQALFQQTIQMSFTEMAAMPEPPDGWDDDELLHDEARENAIEDIHPAADADWTLPLPDLEAELEDTNGSATDDNEAADLDIWLANQAESYPSLPPFIIKPLSHQALESSSMDLDVANAILSRMVQRLVKGKRPETQGTHSLGSIQSLSSNKERKAAVSELVYELLPGDMPGCWTKEDDDALLGVNGREVRRVEDKHGEEAVRSRFEFLEMWNAN